MNHLLSAHNAYCVCGDTKAAVINCLQRKQIIIWGKSNERTNTEYVWAFPASVREVRFLSEFGSEEADSSLCRHWWNNRLTSSLPAKSGCIIAKPVWIKEKMVIFSTRLKRWRNLSPGSECIVVREIKSLQKGDKGGRKKGKGKKIEQLKEN